MNWAFELLGLAADADAASIKRAYARLLRTTRPDEDPEGFQRLHAAYKTALARASAQPVPAALPAVLTTPAEPLAKKEAPQPPSERRAQANVVTVTMPSINLGTLTNEVIQAATKARDGQQLTDWLHARQEFWSIQVKQQSGHRVLNDLFQQPQPICADCMDALLHFFDLDHVLSGINPVALQALRTRQRTLWEVQPANHRELAKRMGLMWGTRPDVTELGRDIALLQKPRTWVQVVRAAFQVGRVRELGRLVQTLLGKGGFDELPPSIDREHAFFWNRAAAPGLKMTKQRFIVGVLRATFAAPVGALGLLALLMMNSMGSPPTEAEWISAISSSASVGAAIFALWPLFACAAWFDQWQGQPETAPARWPWLRRLFIPVVCALGLASYEGGAAGFGGLLVAASFIFAVRKFRHRTVSSNKLSLRVGSMVPAFIFIGISFARAISQLHIGDLPFVPAAAVATAGIVIADLWRHRAHLRPKLARS